MVIPTVKAYPTRGLNQILQNGENVHIRAYADAPFSNNHDLSSQIGFIISLGDDKCNVVVLAFRSSKSRHVVRSVLGAEL